MSAMLQLETLLNSRPEYERLVGPLLTSLERSRDRGQTIKNIVLFCKNCLSIASKPITKYLVLRLINDIIKLVGFDHIAPLIQANILNKVLEACLTHQKAKLSDYNNEDRRQYDEFIRMAIESINYWAENSSNPRSKFRIAAEDLRDKEFESSGQLRPYSNSRTTLHIKNPPDFRPRAKSVSYDDNQTILRLIDVYQGAELFIEGEFKRAERNHSYKIRVLEIVEKLDSFVEQFQQNQRFLKKGHTYQQLEAHVETSKSFLSKLESDKNLSDKQVRRIIEDVFFDPSSESPNYVRRKIQTPESNPIKKLDIFQILENIHRRIEKQQKAQGVFGSYEMKYVSMDDDDKVDPTLGQSRGKGAEIRSISKYS